MEGLTTGSNCPPTQAAVSRPLAASCPGRSLEVSPATRVPAASDVTRDRIERLPKTDLHVHLDGSVRPETLLELAREQRVTLPRRDVAQLRDYMHVQDARDLADYLARFDVTLSVMQTTDALERVAYELAQDAAREHVRYMEVRYSPVLHLQQGLTLDQVVEAPLHGLRRAQAETGIRTGLIICGIRNMSPYTSVELAELTVAYKGRGVIAFDLAGAEYDHPAKRHRAAFDAVARGDMPITIHAGEAYGAASIRQAVHACGAHRIGHGTRLFEDPELMAYVKDRRVPLEICLTSNVQTRVVPALDEHPLRLYYAEGLVVTINTDNRLMSATSVTDEYWLACQHLGFTWAELCDIALMGFRSGFLPQHEKRALLAAARREAEDLTDGAAAPPRSAAAVQAVSAV